jgi:hypothetical protein
MIDSRMRLMALSCGAFILSASCIAVVLNGHGWSWPPFVWGILIGPLWIGWAQVSGEFMAKAAMKPTKIPAEDVAQFRSARWRRWWAGYVSTCLVGVAAGTGSAGLRSPWPDFLFTILFLLMGVLIPLTLFPTVKRSVIARQQRRTE